MLVTPMFLGLGGLIAGIVSAVGAIGTGIYNIFHQRKVEKHLTGSQQEQNQYNAIQAGINRDFTAAEAQKSRDFTEYMARNKYSMETQSMQDAGVNPAMVYGGGSLVPTAANGATGSGSAASGQGSGNANVAGLTDLIEPLMAAVRMPLELQKLQAEINKTKADTSNTEADTEGKNISNEINSATKDSLIRFQNMAPEEREAQINKIVQETKSEEIKTDILGVELIQSKLDYEQNKRMNELVFQMQKMQNEYQEFVNNHQERQWNKEYDKLCAEVCDLYADAKKKMSDIELNNAEISLKGAETSLTNEKVKTEGTTQVRNISESARAYYDPKAHITHSVIAPMQKLHDLVVSDKSGRHSRQEARSREGFRKITAQRIQQMYATTGQAITEYGE